MAHLNGRGNAGAPRHGREGANAQLNRGAGRHGGDGVNLQGHAAPDVQAELAAHGQEEARDDVCRYAHLPGGCLNHRCRYQHPGEDERGVPIWTDGGFSPGCYEVSYLVYNPAEDAPREGGEPLVCDFDERRNMFVPGRLYPEDHPMNFVHLENVRGARIRTPFYYHGPDGALSRSLRVCMLDNGDVRFCLAQGSVLDYGVKEVRPGAVVVSVESQGMGRATGFMRSGVLPPQYELRSAGRNVLYIAPLLSKLVREYCSTAIDSTVAESASAYVLRKYGMFVGVWSDLVKDTVDTVQCAMLVRLAGLRPCRTIDLGAPMRGPSSVISLHVGKNGMVPVRSHSFLTNDPAPMSVPFRENVHVVKAKGTFADGELIVPNPSLTRFMDEQLGGLYTWRARGLPVFRTWGDAPVPVKGETFVRFTGGIPKFGVNTVCTETMMYALTRIVSPRPDEGELRLGEARLIGAAVFGMGHQYAPEGSMFHGGRYFRNRGNIEQFWNKMDWSARSYLTERELGWMEPRRVGGRLQRPTYTRLVAEKPGEVFGALAAINAVTSEIGPNLLYQVLAGTRNMRTNVALNLELTKYTIEKFLHHNVVATDPSYNSAELFRRLNAEVQHVKRKLKMAMVAKVKVHSPGDCMVDVVDLKLKATEPVKPGVTVAGETRFKPTRLIADMKSGSEYAGALATALKATLDGYHTWAEGDMTFDVVLAMKPSKAELNSIFAFVDAGRSRNDTITAAAHSDDKLVSINRHGRKFTYNLDISGCDRSNKTFMHTVLGSVYERLGPAYAKGLVDQCRAPARVTNPANAEESFVFYPNGRGGVTQYSGSVNTTAINTLASVAILGAIGGAVSKLTVAEIDSVDMVEVIKAAAISIGYAVTCTPCDGPDGYRPELMEFLKHSWAPKVNHAYLQPAAILRSFGTMQGAVNATRLGWTEAQYTIARRQHGDMLNRIGSMIVNGLVHEGGSIVNALRERYNQRDAPTEAFGYAAAILLENSSSQKTNEKEKEELDRGIDEAQLRRYYNMRPEDLTELVNKILMSTEGNQYDDYATGCMYTSDYSLAVCDRADCESLGRVGEVPWRAPMGHPGAIGQ